MSALFSVPLPTHLRRRGEIVGIVCGLLFLQLPLFLSPCFSKEPQQISTDASTITGEELTEVYQQALARFAPANKEVLRRAERAWIEFSNKHEAVVAALRRENLLTQEAAIDAEMGEVFERTNHLRTFFVTGNPMPNTEKSAWKNEDQSLQKVYDECIRRLNGNAQRLLREAERAWIIYRDADAASVGFAYKSEAVLNTAALRLTKIRSAQLTALLNPNNARPATPEPTAHVDSPNPEDSKTVAAFRDEVKDALKGFLAKKDEPFFKEADTLKNVPDLPPDVADQLSKLGLKYAALSRKSSKVLEPALNEYAAARLLAGWSAFLRQLKTGSVDDAAAPIRDALNAKPKDVSPDYLTLWRIASNWQDVYGKDAPKFRAHVTKARDLAGRGKTSDAIKEYEAAYDIIENSSIPEQIKKLRQQSLGL